MRPDILFPLFADITKVDGIGPRTADLIEKAVGRRVRDVLLTPPSGIVERKRLPNIAAAADDDIVTLLVNVDEHIPGRNRRQPYKILTSDETGELMLTFFHARPDYLNRILPQGGQRLISGKLERYRGQTQMTHPDYVLPESEEADIPAFETIYPLTAGLTQKMMRKAVTGAFQTCPTLTEWQGGAMLKSEDWPAWFPALHNLHFPASKIEAGSDSVFRRRLAYDELFAKQLALALMREHTRKASGRDFSVKGEYVKEVLAAAPFTPTAAQTRTYAEIAKDLSAPFKMARLATRRCRRRQNICRRPRRSPCLRSGRASGDYGTRRKSWRGSM